MAEEYGKIRKSLMVGIADAIRAKKETTAIFTPEQMAVEIESIVTGDDLLNAEDFSFGTAPAGATEYGMTADTASASMISNYNTVGHQFQLAESICVYGFRYYIYSAKYEHNLRLWDASGKLLASATSTPTKTVSWTEVMLDTPVTLKAGETYIVADYAYSVHSVGASGATFSDKLKNVKGKILTNNYGIPTVDRTSGWALVDILFGPAQTESPVTEYKIQTDTMTRIADEVKRITGATATLSPAQIITALQGIATPSTE